MCVWVYKEERICPEIHSAQQLPYAGRTQASHTQTLSARSHHRGSTTCQNAWGFAEQTALLRGWYRQGRNLDLGKSSILLLGALGRSSKCTYRTCQQGAGNSTKQSGAPGAYNVIKILWRAGWCGLTPLIPALWRQSKKVTTNSRPASDHSKTLPQNWPR